ncbi:hypothetical protein E4T56_gene10863 [Termitomyces sp. T112]|nr:hypothetical protein E4T56_gene10863 [Termitomyces sp. T112]
MFFGLTNSPATFQTMMNNIFQDLIADGIVRIPLDHSPHNSFFQVEADSSDFATGAVLLQQSPEDGKWHLVAFYSKSLNAVEWNHKIHDKEMLAIIWLFEEWQHFLEGPVDFIVELPNTHGYNAIMVVVDLFGKQAYFIPIHTTCSAIGTTNLYQRNIWKLHSLSNAYVPDWGPQFVAEFTRKLYQLLRVKLHDSTAYHPQSDG